MLLTDKISALGQHNQERPLLRTKTEGKMEGKKTRWRPRVTLLDLNDQGWLHEVEGESRTNVMNGDIGCANLPGKAENQKKKLEHLAKSTSA